MTRSHKVLGFLFVALLGIYGCARGPAGAAGADRAGEAKVQRLEADLQAAAAARDAFRQKALAAEQQLVAAQRRFEAERAAAAHERENLSAQLKARTGERDSLQAQHATFIKTLREQLDKAETALNNGFGPPPTLVGAQGPTVAGGGN